MDFWAFFFLSKVLLLEWKFTVSSAAGALNCIVKGKLENFTCICFLLEKWNPNEILIWKYLKGVFSIFLIYYIHDLSFYTDFFLEPNSSRLSVFCDSICICVCVRTVIWLFNRTAFAIYLFLVKTIATACGTWCINRTASNHTNLYAGFPISFRPQSLYILSVEIYFVFMFKLFRSCITDLFVKKSKMHVIYHMHLFRAKKKSNT